MWIPPYNFLNFCILARILSPIHPFILKAFATELSIVEIVFLYGAVSFVISTFFFIFFHDHSRNATFIKKIKDKKNIGLLIILALIFLFTNVVKLSIYEFD